ncbi:PREDICTED: DNA-directed RNA polymerase III subunit RPC4-like isoform X3 [Priapulus caudatus]|uniref:DNA-directed RNA polymerase III subunit RPC4-like isoform X3 n=1 Tax=Priapulus caudatus TaxID=37621 RepID=A0ABM1EYM7_PRICU|nr:PREDICTED: DNA-directed RNA polymerase III subunit RPC4-like isoform X3 [Priapulus caudatus]
MAEEQPPEKTLPRGLINRAGTPTGRGARLPSLRTPRDLTLGGIPKKTFAPNISSRREKKEAGDGPSPSTSKSSERKQSRGRGERGRGRGRGKPEVIQSGGIFSQGPADRLNKTRGSWGTSAESDHIPKPVIKREATAKARTVDDKRILDLLRDDFIDDVGSNEEGLNPVQLPLTTASAVKEEVRVVPPAHKMILEVEGVKVKSEPQSPERVPLKPDLGKKAFRNVPAPETTCQDIFDGVAKLGDAQLLFLQLPDLLPGLPSGRDDAVTGKDAGGSQGAPAQESLGGCRLDDVSEGYIGKLLVRKSGRTQIVLGNVTMNVEMGANCGFLQVSKRAAAAAGSPGDIAILGHVRHRLVCSPDFDSLLAS